MATKPLEANDNATPEQPDPPIRHQQGRDNPSGENVSADEAASQQQQ